MDLIKQSLALDQRFFKVSPWSFSVKIIFIITKYASIIKHFYSPFELGRSNIKFKNKRLYYDSRLGLSGYQSMLTRHQYMLQIANIKPGEIETVIDCGANVGFFSLMINGIYPSASVYAIEPVPLTLKTLKKNVGTVPQIICSQDAISDKKGIAHMSFDANESVISQLSSEGSIKVNKITLDQYCVNNSIKAIDILKIDTETFEAHVLRGSSGILSKTKYLFIELTIRDNNNYTISYLMSLLYSKLYNFQLIAYRNYSNRSEGHVEIMDCLLFNQNLIGQKYN